MAVAKEQIRQIISENNISSVADVYTLLKDSFKDILQELMEAELDATLGYEKNHKGDLQTDNKRNGHSTKNLKSQYGEFQIDVPRDRNGEFEPKLIPKYQRGISGIEEKVISLYARGMSTRDIHDQLQDLYGIELSAEMVSKITDKILPQVIAVAKELGVIRKDYFDGYVASSEPGVSFCLYGLYSLQSPGGWQDLKPCCLCCSWCYSGRVQRYPQHHSRSQ